MSDIDLTRVSKKELLALCQRLAAGQMAMQSAVESLYGLPDEERGKRIIMEFPTVQGSRNRRMLQAFGERPTDKDLANSAFNKLVHGRFD